MGIVHIDDELHDQLRRACAVTSRSVNAQASYWIRLGMLCELHPGRSLQQIVAERFHAAGVVPAPDPDAARA